MLCYWLALSEKVMGIIFWGLRLFVFLLVYYGGKLLFWLLTPRE